jgi:hypothetical protein
MWVIKPKFTIGNGIASGFFGDALTPSDRNTLINSIDPQHVFSTISQRPKWEIMKVR